MFVKIHTAAKTAGMAKQSLYLQAKKRPLPAYMTDVNGVVMIDLDGEIWKAYAYNYKKKKGLLKKEEDRFNKLISCTVESIKTVFDPGPGELNKLLTMINEKFSNDEE